MTDPTTYRVRPPDPVAAAEFGRACGLGAAAGQVLLHRGIVDRDRASRFLAPRLSDLTSPDDMVDRAAAADRLARAIRHRERIIVFGDYDVDGTTSAAILADILEALAGDVVALVANRFGGGYGFSDDALGRCLELNPAVIVTCDCGSSDHERIHAAMKRGVDVIVVDHHLVPADPLPALAFINPHRPECGFAYKGLASAGLALSMGAAIRRAVGSSLDLRPWLDLVALGTVADVAPLDGDNRCLVRAGLGVLSAGGARPGVRALLQAARIRPGSTVVAGDIAFRLAPRLNAAGRLGDPSITLRLLRARDIMEARGCAARIEQINEQRKAIERQVTEAAIAQVESVYGARPEHGVVVAGEDWHRGVVGITAARLVDRFSVPAVVIAFEDGIGHGSCRTPEGLSLYEAVRRCSDYLVRFGGHDAAAGLTVTGGHLEAFRAAFADATRDLRLQLPTAIEETMVDVELDGGMFGLPSVEDLTRLEPLGEANPEPTFALPEVRIEGRKVVGDNHLALEVRLGNRSVRAFGYEMAPKLESLPERITPIGCIRPDSWRGNGAVELRIAQLDARRLS